MKKKLIKIFLIISIFFSFNILNTNAVNFWVATEATSKISSVSIDAKSWKIEDQINLITKKVFKTLKIVIGWLLVIYLVYAWTMMIISMWNDEEKLSASKKTFWYTIVWLLFINIPWKLYDAFSWKITSDNISWSPWNTTTIYTRNIFMNSQDFWNTFDWVISFLQISIVVVAIFIIVLSWIKIMLAKWKEEDITENKNKILWSLAWLVFIGIMEVWRNIIFSWDFSWKWKELFSSLANLALFFAWPIAIFFLSLAWYYYITASWDEEKIKKAKNIIINTLLATLILLWMYTFLLDLNTLTL